MEDEWRQNLEKTGRYKEVGWFTEMMQSPRKEKQYKK